MSLCHPRSGALLHMVPPARGSMPSCRHYLATGRRKLGMLYRGVHADTIWPQVVEDLECLYQGMHADINSGKDALGRRKRRPILRGRFFDGSERIDPSSTNPTPANRRKVSGPYGGPWRWWYTAELYLPCRPIHQHPVWDSGAAGPCHRKILGRRGRPGVDKAWMKTTAWTNETTDGRV